MVLDEGSESLEGMFVSKDYFRVVGLDPLLGRTFSEVEASSLPRLSSSSATSASLREYTRTSA